MIINSITELIGNTPLLRIPQEVSGLQNIDLYAKLEMMNPFGSVKDRIAWSMLRPHLAELKEGKKLVLENSSGNTAKALQAICGMHGISFKLVTAMARIPEPKKVLKVLGAEIEEIPSASDCFDPNDPNDPQYLIERIVEDNPDKAFFTSQFTNKSNPDEHYQSTGSEIIEDLKTVDYLIGGLGTSGSTFGAGKRIRETSPDLKLFGLTAEKYDFIPGIRTVDEMWETGVYQESAYDKIQPISSSKALDGMLTLNRRCGLLCGPTSGANFEGALDLLKGEDLQLQESGERKTAVFIVCDRLEWYISYIENRRPELFGEVSEKKRLYGLSIEEIEEAPARTATDLPNWLESANPLVVDVRSKVAFQLGSLPDAVNIPLEILEPLLESGHPFEKKRPVLFVCQIGVKTRAAAAYLCAQGYEAYHLEGGIRAWRDRGENLWEQIVPTGSSYQL